MPDSYEIAQNPARDCNLNGTLDSCEIAGGAQDKDADGVIDECEYGRGDCNLDGQISADDLAELLSLWGFINPPYGDLNHDNIVAGDDLAILLSNWGPY